MISKTHISGQKPRGRQLNTKVCDSKSAIFRILLSFFLSCYDFCSNNDNSKTVQALTLILARNGCSSQCAASQPLSVFIVSNSPWSIKAIHNTVVAVRCEGRHFLMLYACAHVVSFPGQIPRSHCLGTRLVHERNREWTTRTAGTVSSRSGQGLRTPHR